MPLSPNNAPAQYHGGVLLIISIPTGDVFADSHFCVPKGSRLYPIVSLAVLWNSVALILCDHYIKMYISH